MSELFHTLGIDINLLAAQLLNFLILLIILRFTIYKPLLEMMRKRRERIEFGLKGADEVDRRLAAIEEERLSKLKAADQEALELMRQIEQSGKKRYGEIVHGAEEKADYLLKEAAAVSKQKQQEAMDEVLKQAQEVVKSALVKTVELDPSAVDEKLINQALKKI